MPMTDSYEWAKANMPQGLMNDNPISNYQYNYINDINSGVYSGNSGGLTLLQYDLSSLYNSSSLTSCQNHFICIPLVRCARAFATDGSALTLSDTNFYLTSLKNFNTSLIHQADLLLNGKTVHQLQPYSGIYTAIKLASQLSADDLALYGDMLGIQKMDNPDSMTFLAGASPALSGISGPSIANNYVQGSPTQQSYTGASDYQGVGIANDAIQRKIMVNKSYTTNQRQNLNLITPTNQADFEFKPKFYIDATGVAVWLDYAIIFVKDLLDVMDNIGLVRRLDGILRLYVNTGFTSVTTTANGMVYSAGNSTFTDVCPILINSVGTAVPRTNGTCVRVTAGLFVARAPNYTYSIGNASVNFSPIASPMNATRYYYNQVVLQPSLQLEYLSSHNAKTVIYKNMYYNTFVNISAGQNFSQLIQSGVTNIKNVIIVPLISQSNAFTQFPAYQSPLDPVGGASGHPLSLINLQVAIGGTNQLSTTLSYDYSMFIEQISKYNKESSSEYGVDSGLWSPSFWMNNRFYVVAVRSTEDDLNTPRNVVISFTNNSNYTIDVLVFCEFQDRLVINCGTGMITK